MERVRTHRDLRVWQECLALAEAVYSTTSHFAPEERYGLSLQIRRAAVSVLSNIAEGAARDSSRDFARFLSIARGSLAELDSQVLLALRLNLIRDAAHVEAQIERVGRMLTGLIAAIRKRTRKSP